MSLREQIDMAKKIVKDPESKKIVEGFDDWLKAKDPEKYEMLLPLKKKSTAVLATRYLPQMFELSKLMEQYLREKAEVKDLGKDKD